MLRWLILISWLGIAPRALGAEEPPTFIIESDRFSQAQINDYHIGHFPEKLSEAELLAILAEKRYKETDRYHLVYKHHFYFSYLVDNRSGRTQRAYLRYPIWFPETESWVHRDGRMIPLQRYPRWGDTFYLDLPPGQHRIVGMRLAKSVQEGRASGVHLMDFASLEEDWRGEEMVVAIIFGAVVTMMFYNLGMYLVYRRVFFIYYFIYSGAAIGVFSSMLGYARYSVPAVSVYAFVGSFALVLFCNSSLNLRQKLPRLYRSSWLCLFVCLLLSAYSFVTGHWIGFALSMPAVMSFCLVTSIFSLRSGYRPALYFVLGWGVFLICCVVVVLNAGIWGNGFLSYCALFGFAAEVSFFSFAIGQKVRLAEQEALRANEHAFNQLKKVFYPHQISKIKEGLALEETMPTHEKEACALCFDIVGSSQIERSMGRSFIEDSIKACESALAERYDGTSMMATGYRVKEMGDGFLCTVGYPFHTVDGRDPAVGAMELAHELVRIFQKRVDELVPDQPVFCSVGLAFGGMQGHFPKVGVVEYEVDGPAVDLAQRYENFRKLHFPQGPAGHIVSVQAALFARLPSHLQTDFVPVDLREANIGMRDDPSATHLYYRIIHPRSVREPLQFSA